MCTLANSNTVEKCKTLSLLEASLFLIMMMKRAKLGDHSCPRSDLKLLHRPGYLSLSKDETTQARSTARSQLSE